MAGIARVFLALFAAGCCLFCVAQIPSAWVEARRLMEWIPDWGPVVLRAAVLIGGGPVGWACLVWFALRDPRVRRDIDAVAKSWWLDLGLLVLFAGIVFAWILAEMFPEPRLAEIPVLIGAAIVPAWAVLSCWQGVRRWRAASLEETDEPEPAAALPEPEESGSAAVGIVRVALGLFAGACCLFCVAQMPRLWGEYGRAFAAQADMWAEVACAAVVMLGGGAFGWACLAWFSVRDARVRHDIDAVAVTWWRDLCLLVCFAGAVAAWLFAEIFTSPRLVDIPVVIGAAVVPAWATFSCWQGLRRWRAASLGA